MIILFPLVAFCFTIFGIDIILDPMRYVRLG